MAEPKPPFDSLPVRPTTTNPSGRFRVCVISTVNHNVGDDFVREGILWLLCHAMELDRADLDVRVIHKHTPITARGGLWESLDRLTRGKPGTGMLSSFLDRLPLHPATDAVLNSDLVIQSGAPVYWKNRYSSCAETEWFEPLIEKRWSQVRDRVPLLNIGAGSCQSVESDGSEVAGDPACRAFIRKFHEYAALTTVRDPLAAQILKSCGVNAPQLPCPSILAPLAANIKKKPASYIALNYMPLGGHYDLAELGPEISQKWERLFVEQTRKVAATQPCLMICHDAREVAAAARLLPEVPRFFSRDWRDYLQAYSHCSRAIVNRVHAAMVTAAMNRPVLLVGNDSRILTAKGFPGVTTLPVNSPEQTLRSAMERLLVTEEAGDLGDYIQKVADQYLVRLREVLPA